MKTTFRLWKARNHAAVHIHSRKQQAPRPHPTATATQCNKWMCASIDAWVLFPSLKRKHDAICNSTTQDQQKRAQHFIISCLSILTEKSFPIQVQFSNKHPSGRNIDYEPSSRAYSNAIRNATMYGLQNTTRERKVL
jgi:hypothetical protein